MKKILFLFFLIVVIGISQNVDSLVTTYDPLNKPNTYKNIDNPNYWKNKLPYEGYWQQDVYYEIKAEINDLDNIITASQKLTYWNNSPRNKNYLFIF